MHARTLVPVIACLTFPLLVAAQDGQLRLPDLTALKAHAVESVHLTLDPVALSFASAFMSERDAGARQLKETFRQITSVTVRSFELDADLAQPDPEVEDVRRQLSGEGWTPLVRVHHRDKNEDVGVYIAHDGHQIHGLAILAVEPREVTLVHIVGDVEPSRLAALRKAFTPADATAAVSAP
jgi:hypothetical protein